MVKKNDKIVLDIIDMTSEGFGIAKNGTFVYFVKDALLGDKVSVVVTKVTEKIVYAKVIDIIEKSKYRIDPKCSVSNSCGGCQVMPLSYDKQLELKTNIVKNNLKRIASISEKNIEAVFKGIIGMKNPYNYRNKVQVPFAYKDGKVISGFYATRTHYIIENEGCIVSFEAAYRIIDEVKKYLSESDKITIYNETSGHGVLRELMLRKGNKTHEISVTLIVNDKKKDKEKYMELVERLLKINGNIKTITLNINTGNNNILFGNENIVLYGNGYIEDEICGLKFHISPESFYQINSIQTEKLYNEALEFIDDIEKIDNALDLYCGIGTITLLLSKKVKNITGLEIVKKAIDDAIENAELNNIDNASFICADAGDIKSIVHEDFDLLSVDPPRKGLDIRTIDFIKEKMPKYLLYISCDSATLSRDIKLLSDKYSVKKIECVDMFPHTMHVETIVFMKKLEKISEDI